MSINDDAALEREADVMGAKALQMRDGVGQSQTIIRSPASFGMGMSQLVQMKEWVVCSDPKYKKWSSTVGDLDWWYNIEDMTMEFRIVNYDPQNKYHQILVGEQAKPKTYDKWISFWRDKGWLTESSIGQVPAVPVVEEAKPSIPVFVGELESKKQEDILTDLRENYDNVNMAVKFKLSELAAGSQQYDSLDAVAKALNAKGTKLTVKQDVVLTFGESTAYDEDKLRQAITKLYSKNPRPTKNQMLVVIRALYSERSIDAIVQSQEFVYGLQKIVRERFRAQNSEDEFFAKTEITDLEKPESVEDIESYQMSDISKWTLRHYSAKGTDEVPPPFQEIKSAVALGVRDTRRDTAGGHTGKVDWSKYGRVGNTFYLLYVAGKVVQKQKFLDNAKWYCEFPLQNIPSLWVSSDWLDESGIKGEAIRGSVSDVQKRLLKLGGKGDSDTFIDQLSALYHNFEVKVPGSLQVTTWKKANSN